MPRCLRPEQWTKASYLAVALKLNEHMEVLDGFYQAIGVSSNGMGSIIDRANKLRRERHFPADSRKEIKMIRQRRSRECWRLALGLRFRKEVILMAAKFTLFF